jgi:hypothetical protein
MQRISRTQSSCGFVNDRVRCASTFSCLIGVVSKGASLCAHFGVRKHFLFCDCDSRALRPYFDFLHQLTGNAPWTSHGLARDKHTQGMQLQMPVSLQCPRCIIKKDNCRRVPRAANAINPRYGKLSFPPAGQPVGFPT